MAKILIEDEAAISCAANDDSSFAGTSRHSFLSAHSETDAIFVGNGSDKE